MNNCKIICAALAVLSLVGNAATAQINKGVLLELVNEARRQGSVCGGDSMPPAAPLAWNDLLAKAAQAHSADMNRKKYFSHTAPNGTGMSARVDKAGYKWQQIGENIAQGQTSEEQVVSGWLRSEGHCRNIMNPNFTEMGVGKSGDYWTQNFGAKRQ